MSVDRALTHFPQCFATYAGTVLVFEGLANLLGNQGQFTIQPSDPIWNISTRYVFWVLGIFQVAVGLIHFFGKSLRFANVLLFCLICDMIALRVGFSFYGVRTTRAYFAAVAEHMGLSLNSTMFLFFSIDISLGLGSLIALWAQSPRTAPAVKSSPQLAGL